MQRGVHAHAGVAFVPVDTGRHRVADRNAWRTGRRQVRDFALARIGIDGGADGDLRAIAVGEHAAVALLAARCGVEHGAVEDDAAVAGQRDRVRLA